MPPTMLAAFYEKPWICHCDAPRIWKKRCPMGPWFQKKGAHIANNTFENRKLLKKSFKIDCDSIWCFGNFKSFAFSYYMFANYVPSVEDEDLKMWDIWPYIQKNKNKKCRYAKYFVGLSCSGCIPVLCMDSYCGLFVLVDIA